MLFFTCDIDAIFVFLFLRRNDFFFFATFPIYLASASNLELFEIDRSKIIQIIKNNNNDLSSLFRAQRELQLTSPESLAFVFVFSLFFMCVFFCFFVGFFSFLLLYHEVFFSFPYYTYLHFQRSRTVFHNRQLLQTA